MFRYRGCTLHKLKREPSYCGLDKKLVQCKITQPDQQTCGTPILHTSLGDIFTVTAVIGPSGGPCSVLPLLDFTHPAAHNLAQLSEERERLQKEGSPGSESSCPFCGRS